MEETTKHYLISGRVQGVGFRAFTRRTASGLGLRGWVRNLADGRVEALVAGTPEKVRLFEAQLKIGPSHGEVESVVVAAWPSSAALREFEVRKDGSQPCSEK
jgi:acylphosphatase